MEESAHERKKQQTEYSLIYKEEKHKALKLKSAQRARHDVATGGVVGRLITNIGLMASPQPGRAVRRAPKRRAATRTSIFAPGFEARKKPAHVPIWMQGYGNQKKKKKTRKPIWEM